MDNNKITFITNGFPKAGEMIIYGGKYTYGNGIALNAWDDEGPYATVTQNIPGIALERNEVILNHDVINVNGFDGRDFLSDFLEYMTDGAREITFGPYRTKTLAVRLKDNWMNLCVPMEV